MMRRILGFMDVQRVEERYMVSRVPTAYLLLPFWLHRRGCTCGTL